MMSKRVHTGWLTFNEDNDGHETVSLDGEPIAEVLDYMSGRIVTVSYYISNKEAEEEDLKEDFLINTLYGNLNSNYGACYSEITGYLWTNDDLQVGGHDLRRELESHVGKFLYLIVEVDEKAEEIKQKEREHFMYAQLVSNLVYRAKSCDKTIEQLITDIKNKW